MQLLTDIKEALLHLTFPHVCEGCGSDVLQKEHALCLHCLSSLPQTNFHLHTDNPIERLFMGRVPLTAATAQFYFTKESLMQRLMHSFKYKGNKELGLYLGNLMGQALAASDRFNSIEALVPLPLFHQKKKEEATTRQPFYAKE